LRRVGLVKDNDCKLPSGQKREELSGDL
jgi:hypothetical protein